MCIMELPTTTHKLWIKLGTNCGVCIVYYIASITWHCAHDWMKWNKHTCGLSGIVNNFIDLGLK